MKKIVIALALAACALIAQADHVSPDGLGGFYTPDGHISPDGMGGYYVP